MGMIKDELGIEVEESILARFQDPKFQETEALLKYREQRQLVEMNNLAKEKAKKDEEEENKSKLFGIF